MGLGNLDHGMREGFLERLSRFADELSDDELAALSLLAAQADGSVATTTLAATPPEQLFDAEELELIAELDHAPPPERRLVPKPTFIMKATRLCNLRCTYCNAWDVGPGQKMTFEVLARTTHGLMCNPGVLAPTFVWHGGEPTIRGTAFYLRAMWLQQHWKRPEQSVHNRLQTNATNLDDDFIAMCRRFGISVSVSLDGPPEIHDRQRLDAAGQPTSHKVREGIEQLRAGGIDPGILMVIDRDTVELGAQRVLDYLLELEISAVGLLNVVPGIGEGGVDPYDPWLPWPTWQSFLHEMFRLWWPEHRDRIHIRELMELVRSMRGEVPRMCHHHDDCFSFAFTVEPDGDVGPCDKYVGDPDGRYGSVLSEPLDAVMTSPGVQSRREADRADVDEMSECRWLEVCKGGCPFDRAVNDARGAGVPSGCCGLGPLLDEMEATLAGAGPTGAVEAAFASAGTGSPPTPARTPRTLPVLPN